MMRFTKISSLLLIGTTFGFFMKGWMSPEQLQMDLHEEDIHLYL
ncbi:hypothetical protein [Pontibacter sp. HSC-36F09]|nr:hypothetical protein [Pontibacter sp. HSC-36F09]MCP2045158.1 hypothetical protein [Pontibacter sp. HSC-36F09]